MSLVDNVHDYILANTNSNIVLLKNKEVLMWLFKDHSFLPSIERKSKTRDQIELKKLEDAWGQATLKARRPDLTLDGQWTNKFGEILCEEIFMLLGKSVYKPLIKNNLQPDMETDENIVEAKICTFYTTGTANEKIMGVPFKYADVPLLYKKPLIIFCMGGAEWICREQYGVFAGNKCSPTKQRILDFYRNELNITFMSATTVLSGLVVTD